MKHARTQLAIIGRGWAKHHDLSVASRSIIDNSSARHYKSRYFAITEFNNCFIVRVTEFFFFKEYLSEKYLYISGSEAICHFHARAIARRRKAWFHLCMSRIVFAAKNSWTTLRMSTPLFVGSYLQVTWWALCQWKGSNVCIEWWLTIIGRGWAKYRDLPVASRSIICRRRRLRQIIDLRDTNKSRYFAITGFNNCFIAL